MLVGVNHRLICAVAFCSSYYLLTLSNSQLTEGNAKRYMASPHPAVLGLVGVPMGLGSSVKSSLGFFRLRKSRDVAKIVRLNTPRTKHELMEAGIVAILMPKDSLIVSQCPLY